MPHVDELLGPATFAAAGLFAAIALQPPASVAAPARTAPTVATAAVVPLPAVEVVARRSPALAQIERDQARERGPAKPRA